MATNLLPMLADPELPAELLAEMEQLNADAAIIDL
jgi:hypothetical protein